VAAEASESFFEAFCSFQSLGDDIPKIEKEINGIAYPNQSFRIGIPRGGATSGDLYRDRIWA